MARTLQIIGRHSVSKYEDVETMIEAANIFVKTSPAGQAVSPAKPASQIEEHSPSRKNGPLRESATTNNFRDNSAKERNPHAQSEPFRGSKNNPAETGEEKASKGKTQKAVAFEQMIAHAMVENPETPTEIPAGGQPHTEVVETTDISPAGPVTVPNEAGRNTSPQPFPPVVSPTRNPAEGPTTAEKASEGLSAPATKTTDIPLPNPAAEGVAVPEHTSGRPESTSLETMSIPADIPRTNVTATDSSTVTGTAATETNPNPGDSGAATPGRPVVSFTINEAPPANAQEGKPSETTVVAPGNEKHSETPANASPDSSSSNDAGSKAQTFVPRASAKTPSETPAAPRVHAQTPDPSGNFSRAETISSVPPSRVEDITSVPNPRLNTDTTTAPPPGLDAAAMSAMRGARAAEQITTHIQMRRDNLGEEMVVRLDPPELGRVHIQIRIEHGELTGVIRTDNAQTHADLQRESASLLQRLNEAGVDVKTLDLQMNDMSQQGRGEQSFAQAQNAYSTFPQNQGQERGYGHHQADAKEFANRLADDSDEFNTRTGQYVSDSALNVML